MKAATFANLLISLLLTAPVHGEEHISYGRFKGVVLYEPNGEVKEFVLFQP